MSLFIKGSVPYRTSVVATSLSFVFFNSHPFCGDCYCISCLLFLFQSSNVEDTFKWCGEVLEGDENDVDALCDRAEMYIQQDLFEEAIRDYQKANEKKNDYASSCNVSCHLGTPSLPDLCLLFCMLQVEEKLQRAQKLLKQSQKRDYYKILGVPR